MYIPTAGTPGKLNCCIVQLLVNTQKSLPFQTWLLRCYSYQGGYRDLGQPMNVFQKVMNSDQEAIQPRWQRFAFRRPRSRDRRPEVNTSARLLTLKRRRCPFVVELGAKYPIFISLALILLSIGTKSFLSKNKRPR